MSRLMTFLAGFRSAAMRIHGLLEEVRVRVQPTVDRFHTSSKRSTVGWTLTRTSSSRP